MSVQRKMNFIFCTSIFKYEAGLNYLNKFFTCSNLPNHLFKCLLFRQLERVTLYRIVWVFNIFLQKVKIPVLSVIGRGAAGCFIFPENAGGCRMAFCVVDGRLYKALQWFYCQPYRKLCRKGFLLSWEKFL